LLFALGTAQGCYVYTPVVTTTPVGTTLALDLSDRGRVGMGEQIGTSAKTIEGVLRTETDSAYVLNVSSVVYLNGQKNAWTGERLTLPRTMIANTRERRFSRSRTALAAAIGVGGVIAFIASRGLLGLGNTSPDPGPGPPGENQ
jgi:hypothetical protein